MSLRDITDNMIRWVKELEQKLDKPGSVGYDKLRNLQEEKFQGNIRINFNSGRISSINPYETIKL